SVMSRLKLGQPFDIHTGGIVLKFPHHENEIAQSTAGNNSPIYATTFMHNDHILVDGKKMAKSAQNFYTLADLGKNGVDPLAFRLLVLQSHYRNPTNYSHDNAEAAHNRLIHWRDIACLRHQIHDTIEDDDSKRLALHATSGAILEALQADIDTPRALAVIDDAFGRLEQSNIDHINRSAFMQLLELIDETLGLKLIDSTPDIDDEAKRIIIERERARDDKNWQLSDKFRDELNAKGIAIRDTSSGTVWSKLAD
ncbi:MAG: cysteine--tRNA ligase, partial [Candidatus Saccharimonadaceae bacterium]